MDRDTSERSSEGSEIWDKVIEPPKDSGPDPWTEEWAAQAIRELPERRRNEDG